MTTRYWKVMLGARSAHAEICRSEGFVGTDFEIDEDLTGRFPGTLREFNKEWVPYFLQLNPEKGKISAGLSAGQLWTVSHGIAVGDIVLAPTGKSGEMWVGSVSSDYYFESDGPLPHRRRVEWKPGVIRREDLTSSLRASLGYAGTVCDISLHAEEIMTLISEHDPDCQSSPDLAVFALESILEEFLVTNWSRTSLGERYEIVSEGGELIGRQYPTDTGPMDILAISKDRGTLLVVELKRDKASDRVVGQIQRYMGYVIDEVATPEQVVRGVIIALDDDTRLRRALRVAQNIDFYRYEIDFRLKLANLSDLSG
jgi:restriction system protein